MKSKKPPMLANVTPTPRQKIEDDAIEAAARVARCRAKIEQALREERCTLAATQFNVVPK